MLHTPIATFEKLDKGDVTTVVLGTLVVSMCATIIVLLYLPIR